jgi:hypothetical protein
MLAPLLLQVKGIQHSPWYMLTPGACVCVTPIELLARQPNARGVAARHTRARQQQAGAPAQMPHLPPMLGSLLTQRSPLAAAAARHGRAWRRGGACTRVRRARHAMVPVGQQTAPPACCGTCCSLCSLLG